MTHEAEEHDIEELLRLVGSKRARIVIEHIVEHGFITTEELERDYGYAHPPRAARDVREAGIPLVTFRVISSDGRSIAAYKLGDSATVQKARAGGRKNFSKAFKKDLHEASDGRCAICSGHFKARYLQIDHRIPYEVSGDAHGFEQNIDHYTLLCASCNRAKSWSCENCPNWTSKSASICSRCYWAYPEDHTHIALMEVRRTDVLWQGRREVELYEELKRVAKERQLTIPNYVKRIVGKTIGDEDE